MRFIKMQGIGNDYIVLDALSEPRLAQRDDLPQLARRMSDRHNGAGSDGLIILSAPDDPGADLAMRIINADGSEGGICGNGTRCAAKFAVDRGYVIPSPDGRLFVQCGGRLLVVTVETDAQGLIAGATVDMGEPILDLPLIPVDASRLGPACPARAGGIGGVVDRHVEHRTASFVSMGNPHMIAFIDEPVDRVDLAREGPIFERHPAFPQRINYHVVNALSAGEARVRTWERGAGPTRGCGSGACAVVVAGVATGRLDRRLLVHMPGGDLRLHWDERTNHVLMSGPAAEVFQGDWPV